jgi:hypothetical protein
MQRGLQDPRGAIGSVEPNPLALRLYVHLFASFRPEALVPYEHMFSHKRTSPKGQRALGALRLARSFLLLEDDHEFGWEADQDEPATAQHPHRAPLHAGARRRRPGQPQARPAVCLSPIVPNGPHRPAATARLSAERFFACGQHYTRP